MLTEIHQLGDVGISPDPLRRLTSAKVVIADYPLLQRDFPQLRDAHVRRTFPEIAFMSSHDARQYIERRIDDWLLEHAGFIAEAQLARTDVNSTISFAGQAVPSYRPARYGRATVVDVRQVSSENSAWQRDGPRNDGLLDLKGIGVRHGRTPIRTPYGTGLEYLGVALGDFLIKRLIDEILARTVPSISTVPVYAILDMGFDLVEGWSGTGPAGMHVRAAHTRPAEPLWTADSDGEKLSVFLELLFRSYGLTTVNQGNCVVIEERAGEMFVASGQQDISHALDDEDIRRLRRLKGPSEQLRIERINFQLAGTLDAGRKTAQIYDFGHMNIRAEFHNPLASTVSDRWLCLGGILWPESPAFVLPDPRLAAPLAAWHRHRINELCFTLAARFRDGSIDRAGVRAALDDRVSELVTRWPVATPRATACERQRANAG